MAKSNRQIMRQREVTAWTMRQKGATYYEIAEVLNVNDSTVERTLQRVEKRALEKMDDMVLRIKLEQTFQLESMVSECMQAWRESRKRQTQVSVKKNDPKEKGFQEYTRTTKKGTGAVQYLEEARRLMEDIRKIWGVNEPETLALDMTVLPKIVAIGAGSNQVEPKHPNTDYEMPKEENQVIDAEVREVQASGTN